MGMCIADVVGGLSKAGTRGVGVRVYADRWGSQASGSIEGELTRPEQSLTKEKVEDRLVRV